MAEQTETPPNFDAADECLNPVLDLILANRKRRPVAERIQSSVPLSSLLAAPMPSVDPYLYHYTTAEGLQGIVEQGCLHATSAYYMNDSSEIDYGCRMFCQIVQTWSRTNAKLNTAAARALRYAQEVFENNLVQSTLPHVHLICFCEGENLLSQWRAYGQSGGYSIGFVRSSLSSELTAEGEEYYVLLKKVIYRADTQTTILNWLLTDLLSPLGDPQLEARLDKLSAHEAVYFGKAIDYFFGRTVLNEVLCFKHPAFEEEKEWRLVVQPMRQMFPLPLPMQPKSLKFKVLRGVPTPYLELRPISNLLPISSVRYGPTLEKRRTENALRLLFDKYGYSDMKFHGSNIPVRL